jgi:site-specific recombinase XerD
MRSLPLSKVIEGFTLACRARQLSVHTIDDYSRTMKKFAAHVGDQSINSITSTQVSAFLASQTKLSKKTVLNYHIGLSAMWTWAEKEQYVEKHVLHMVERPRPKKIVISPFTEVEIRALISAIQYAPARNRALILLLLDTGGRASEICGLKRTDIDLVARQMKVTGKGDKERFLPFSPRTGSALFSHLATVDGDPFSMGRTGLAQYLRRLGKRAGVVDVHPHRFRHTFAITFLRNGGDPYTLQQILGHSTMEMVKNYLALAQIDLDTAHKRASPVEGWKL